jgi:predicted ester cyclase
MDDNRAVIIKLYQTFDRGEFEDVKCMLSANFAAHLVGMAATLNRDEFTEFGIKFKQAFPDGCHHFDRPICDGDKVVTSGKFTGTHLGDFQGLPATGRSISIAVMHIDRIKDGQVIEHWGQGDQAGMMQQLGIVPLPGIGLFYSAIRHRLGLRKSD